MQVLGLLAAGLPALLANPSLQILDRVTTHAELDEMQRHGTRCWRTSVRAIVAGEFVIASGRGDSNDPAHASSSDHCGAEAGGPVRPPAAFRSIGGRDGCALPLFAGAPAPPPADVRAPAWEQTVASSRLSRAAIAAPHS